VRWRYKRGALWRRAQEGIAYKRRVIFCDSFIGLIASYVKCHRRIIPPTLYLHLLFGGKVIYFSSIPLRVRGCLGTIKHYQFRSADRLSISSPIF